MYPNRPSLNRRLVDSSSFSTLSSRRTRRGLFFYRPTYFRSDPFQFIDTSADQHNVKTSFGQFFGVFFANAVRRSSDHCKNETIVATINIRSVRICGSRMTAASTAQTKNAASRTSDRSFRFVKTVKTSPSVIDPFNSIVPPMYEQKPFRPISMYVRLMDTYYYVAYVARIRLRVVNKRIKNNSRFPVTDGSLAIIYVI